MKYCFILSAALVSCVTTYGQVTFAIGPRLGLNAANARYAFPGQKRETERLLRGEIGGSASVSWRHLALQASVLYTQKGFGVRYQELNSYGNNEQLPSSIDQLYKLNYFALPVNLVYQLQANEQGLEVFAGGYLARLLNGRFVYDNSFEVPVLNGNGATEIVAQKGEAKVKAGNEFPPVGTSASAHLSRPWDAGVQIGAGYRYKQLLVQATYSRGLVDLGPTYPPHISGSRFFGPSYHNRALQLSAAYLFAAR
jgi:hypothetical protein